METKLIDTLEALEKETSLLKTLIGDTALGGVAKKATESTKRMCIALAWQLNSATWNVRFGMKAQDV